MIGTPEFDQFVSEHRWAIVTTLRRDGTPSSSMNAYARDGDQIVISTTSQRLKVRTLERDPRITVCAINNAEPFNYVSVEGTCAVERGDIVRATKLVFANLEKTGYQAPADVQQWITEQGRVILRVTPTRVSGVIRGR